MQAAPTAPGHTPSFGAEPARADDPAQHPDDWAETAAMTVACTMEPTCALAFCFGHFFGKRSAKEPVPAPAPKRRWFRRG